MDVLVFGPWPSIDDEEGYECFAFDESPISTSITNDLEDYDLSSDEHPKKQRGHKYLEWLRRHLVIRKELHKAKKASSDAASVATASTALSSVCPSDCSNDNLSTTAHVGIPLIQQRLIDSGIDIETPRDFEFVVDRVSKETVGLFDEEEEKKEEEANEYVKHVKTGIWQVTCLDNEGNHQEHFYVVTGVCMEDKVCTKKLRKALFADKKHSRRPKISLAPTEIAEKLAGFQSGTMAPICHSVNMKLFLEESIVANADTASHKIAVGSGMFGECLSISADKFLEVAKKNPEGLVVCPLIRKSKGKA